MNREHIWQSGLIPEGILHGSTTKAFGVFRHGRASEDDVAQSRARFAQAVGVSQDHFAFTEQVHGCQVIVAAAGISQDRAEKADALVTNTPGLLLIIKTADCVPVFFFDPVTKSAGVAHAGWPGLAQDVVGETIKAMTAHFHTNPADLLVAVGPAICVHHYDVSTVSDDRVAQFETQFGAASPVIQRKNGKTAFDLPLAAKELALRQGVNAGNIELSGVCTYEQANYWASYRREGANLKHDIWSFIGLA